MRITALAALVLLLPLAAQASDRCDHTATRDLRLDLAGVRSVRFEVGPHDLNVIAAPGRAGEVHGRACASSAERLAGLIVTQQRQGDTLVVTLGSGKSLNFNGFVINSYASLDVRATIPDSLPVQLEVGSGDAEIENVPSLNVQVSSGDAEVRRVRGTVTASVSSGDIELSDIGALDIHKVSSGDVKAHRIAQSVTVRRIGSGDVELTHVGRDVTVDDIGSGGLSVNDVGGSLQVRSVGSGSVHQRGVRGQVSIPRD